MSFTLLGHLMRGGGGGGHPKRTVNTTYLEFPTLGTSKIKVLQKKSDIVTTQKGHASYVKHELGSMCAFFSLFGYWVCAAGWGGSLKGLVGNLLVQIFALGTSKIQASESFFYMMATHNDQSSFEKHALGPICVFFPLLRVCVLGSRGVSQGTGARPPSAAFHRWQFQNRGFRDFFLNCNHSQ